MRLLILVFRTLGVMFGLLSLSAAAMAQTTSIYLVDYARTAGAHQVQLEGVTLQPANSSGSLPRNTVSAGSGLRAELINSDDGSVLASAVFDFAANMRHVLLISGDGSTQPFRLQTVTSAGAEIRVFNAALLPGDAMATALTVDWPSNPEPVQASHGEVSELITPGIYGGMRARRSSDGQTLLQLARRDYDGSGVILVVHGEAETLKVDELSVSTARVTTDLRALAPGPVQVQLLNGGAYLSLTMSVRMSSALPGGSASVGDIFAYGELSPIYTLAESGIYRVCAQPSFGGQFLPDTHVCENVDVDGGKSYVLVSKSYSPDSCCSTLFDDPLPFLLYELTEASAGSARVTLSHAAVAPPLGEFVVVSRDDGSSVQPFRSPFAYQAATGFPDSRVHVLDGPAQTLDLKVRNAVRTRNLADLAPFSVALGEAVDAFLIGDGKDFPYRIVTTAGTASERAVNMDVNGFWTIDEIPLEGFNLTPLPTQDRLLGTWFNHGADGGPTWYTFDSCRSEPGDSVCATPNAFSGNSLAVRVYRTQSAGSTQMLQDAGTMSIEFNNCTQAIATIDLFGQPQQVLHLSNQTPSADCVRVVTGSAGPAG